MPTDDHPNREEVPREEEAAAEGLMIGTHYRRNLRAAVGFSAGPYGYTLTLWSTGAVLTGTHGIPTALSAVTFVVGAVLAFATVGASAFGSLKQDLTREKGHEVLWGSGQIFSVGLSIGAAVLVGYYVEGFMAWPLTGFLITALFLLVVGAESTAAYLWALHQAGHETGPKRGPGPLPRRDRLEAPRARQGPRGGRRRRRRRNRGAVALARGPRRGLRAGLPLRQARLPATHSRLRLRSGDLEGTARTHASGSLAQPGRRSRVEIRYADAGRKPG